MQLAVAERPVGAAEPGIGGAHDDPDRDEPERGREGRRGQLLEAVHEDGHSTPAAARSGRSRYPSGHVSPNALRLRLLLALVLVVVACGPSTPPATPAASPQSAPRPSGCATAPAPASLDGWEAAGHGADASSRSSSRTRSPAARPGSCSSFLDTENRPVASARPDRARSRSTTSRADPTTPVTTVDGDVRLDDRGRARHVRRRRRPSRGRRVGRRVHDRGAGLARRRRSGVTFDRARGFTPTVAVGDEGARLEDPDARRRRRRRRRRSRPTRTPTRPSTRPRSRMRSPPTSRSCSSSRRPKFCTSAQCGPTLDDLKPVAAAHPDVTFINVEPYQLEDVDGQLQPVLDANGQLQATDVTNEWGLPVGAVDLRGRSRRGRARLVRADDHRRPRSSTRSCAVDHRRRLS